MSRLVSVAAGTLPLAVALIAGPGASAQQTVADLLELRKEGNQENSAAQKRIEELSDEIDRLSGSHRTVIKQIAALRVYNDQMAEMIGAQQEQIAEISDELYQLNLVSRDVTPLMLRMIDALEEFVALDAPFLPDERSERIELLRQTMIRSDVTEAEKFRLIMEAYQVENDYGRTIEAYRSTLGRGDEEITVDFLRVGRIALVYQTLDEQEARVWSQEEREWIPLEPSYFPAIRHGLRMARKLTAPDMLQLPLPALNGDDDTGVPIEPKSEI